MKNATALAQEDNFKGYMPVPVICRATNTSYQRKYILYTFKTKV
jgi:hypothetical protein